MLRLGEGPPALALYDSSKLSIGGTSGNDAMPGDARFCRDKAARCAQLAVEQTDPDMKRTFEELALSWTRLAEKLDQLPPGYQESPSKP